MTKGKQPEWGKYGLRDTNSPTPDGTQREQTINHYLPSNDNEIYNEEKAAEEHEPWWRANFFIREPVLFGTWDGVFTSCMINIFGVIIFLRTGWMVGNAGLGMSMLVIGLSVGISLLTLLSAIGICDRTMIQSGGIYYLLSFVLGPRMGGAIGIVYCLGHAIAGALYATGFGESMAVLLHTDNLWVTRAIAAGVLLVLVGFNVAGVKWVIKLQLLLVLILFAAMLDLVVGSFVHTDLADGFVGYNQEVFSNNTGQDYRPGQSFFSVFGVFFPAATGALAGINMSGDLKNPSQDIPKGSLVAMGVGFGIYLMCALLLGATCLREVLQNDYMIAEKVSALGVPWLAGLYISSLSSCLGGLYGAPRILQRLAEDGVIPIIRPLARGTGPNKIPILAIALIMLVSVAFILIGQINILGPIVTIPFLITYAFINYAYFALAMTFDIQKERELKYGPHKPVSRSESSHSANGDAFYGTTDRTPTEKTTDELDQLFPERRKHRSQRPLNKQSSLDNPSHHDDGVPRSESMRSIDSDVSDTAQLIGQGSARKIIKQPRSWYSFLINRWLALVGVVLNLIVLFLVQWLYSLITIALVLGVYGYIGHANPSLTSGIGSMKQVLDGIFLTRAITSSTLIMAKDENSLWEFITPGGGIVEFSLYKWTKRGLFALVGCDYTNSDSSYIVAPTHPGVDVSAARLTQDSEDYIGRERYHQSYVIRGQTFSQYPDKGDSD